MTRPWLHVCWDVEKRLLAGESMESIRGRPCPDAAGGDGSDLYWELILARASRLARHGWRRLCFWRVPGGVCRKFLGRPCRSFCQTLVPYARRPLPPGDPDRVGIRGESDPEVGRRLERMLREYSFLELEKDVHAEWQRQAARGRDDRAGPGRS